MNLWRINLKPANRTGYDSRKHCLDNKIVGIGWPIDNVSELLTMEGYEAEARKKYHLTGDKGWYPAWNSFHTRMEIGDLIWTRTLDGNYFLGKITSDWRYDYSNDAINVDIANIRDCQWIKVGTVDAVPGKIIRSFIPARTLQRVDDETTLIYSQHVFNKLSGLNFYEPTLSVNKEIFSLLSADDCEDIVGLYLQVKLDYTIIPSSCKADTLAYEYELIHKITGEKAVAQVKNGNVDLNRDSYRNIEPKVFLFTTNQKYLGDEDENIICLSTEELKEFMTNCKNVLPQKVKFWVEELAM